MVHQSHETASLEQEVSRLKAIRPESLEKKAAQLQEQTTRLQDDLQANRRVFVPLVGLAFLLGLFAGYAVPHYRARKTNNPPKEP